MCMQSNELSKIYICLQNADCKPRLDDPSSSTHLKSDSAKIVKTYKSMTETEKDLSKNSPKHVNLILIFL